MECTREKEWSAPGRKSGPLILPGTCPQVWQRSAAAVSMVPDQRFCDM